MATRRARRPRRSQYDSAGRLKSIPGYVTAALYNAEGKLTQITTPTAR